MAKAFVVFYGVPGGGKTYEALCAFQNSLYIGSAPNNPHFYKSWLNSPEGKASGLRPPKDELVIDQYAVIMNGKPHITLDPKTNRPVPVKQTDALWRYADMAVTKAQVAMAKGEPPPWNYVIYDEMSTLLGRCFQEISPTVLTKEGKHNLLGAYGVMGDWTANLTNYLRQLVSANVGLCFIAHDQEPDRQNDKKGGPKFTSQAIMKQICADADGVLLRVLEDQALDINNPGEQKMAHRIWRAHASQHHMSKLRGLPDSMFEEIKTMRAGQILNLAGFEA